eukprot:TRINITY_DN30445_c0_g1_i1.p3 TRINITY_DN30445_c0_g1~~TRINITY_DN30445_c0_g1_i1.p3  ORF type:complete len:128 (-),score=9.78 TRINITY_DN30445_c0_g1_i1:35-418(-)
MVSMVDVRWSMKLSSSQAAPEISDVDTKSIGHPAPHTNLGMVSIMGVPNVCSRPTRVHPPQGNHDERILPCTGYWYRPSRTVASSESREMSDGSDVAVGSMISECCSPTSSGSVSYTHLTLPTKRIV